MSTIAVVGVTGYVGGHIADEALRRGHEVIGVSRSTPTDSLPGLTARTGSITDPALVRDLAEHASTIALAVPASVDGMPYLAKLISSLLETAGAFGTRVGIVGGAGSLLMTEGGQRLLDTPEFPEAFKADAEALAEVLDELRSSQSATDWFYLSPAAGFGSYAPGERTGHFRLSGDVLLTMPMATPNSAERTLRLPSLTKSMSRSTTGRGSASLTDR